MIFDGIPLMGMLRTKLGWLTERSDVLSRNIANASTPDYVPTDLTKPDFSAALNEASRGGASGMFVTNARHIQAKPSAHGSYRSVQARDTTSSPDGNGVVVEEQMMKVSETQMAYAEATGLYKKVFSLWRTAISGAQG